MNKIAVLFPGQGSQYVGMGREFYDRFDVARSVFQEARDALGWDVARLCFEGPGEALNRTAKTQPAILTTSIASWKVLEQDVWLRDKLAQATHFVAGHSLGEYTALVMAGGLSFANAVGLVEKRGLFMQEAVPEGVGAMAAVIGLDPDQIHAICADALSEGVVSAANLNCPGQVVIAGNKVAVEKALQWAMERGARKVIPLPVSVPSHCALMEPACRRLSDTLQSTELSDLSIPLVNNSQARILTGSQAIKKSLVAQLRSPLLWEDSIRLMIQQGVRTLIEVGPGRVLSGLVRRISREVTLLNVEDPASLEKTAEALRG